MQGMVLYKVHSNIYLIGPMGSGKTTIGQRLAKLMGMDFFDSDKEMEAQTGASVNLIFDVEGETGFRIRETQMIECLTGRSNVLLATGGGAILKRENREILSKSGLVVYLQVSVQQQLHRLCRDRTRPLLQSGDREQKLMAMAEERNPLYTEIADIIFPAMNRGPTVAARVLAERIQSYSTSEASGTQQSAE
jgi:shikimate kinase